MRASRLFAAMYAYGVVPFRYVVQYRCWCALTDGTIPAELLRELLLYVKDARKIEDADFMTTHCRLRFGHGSALGKHADPSPSEKEHGKGGKSKLLAPRLMYHQLIGSSAYVVECLAPGAEGGGGGGGVDGDGGLGVSAGAGAGAGDADGTHTPGGDDGNHHTDSGSKVLRHREYPGLHGGSPLAVHHRIPAPPPLPSPLMRSRTSGSSLSYSHTPVPKAKHLERHDIRTAENPFVPVEVCQSSNLYLLPPKVCVCV